MGNQVPKDEGNYITEVKGSARPGSSPIYRSSLANPDLKYELQSKATTLYESIIFSFKTNPNANMLGTRENIQGQLGSYKWKTYSEVNIMAHNLGFALKNLNLFEPDSDGNSFACIYSKNRIEWIIADLACMSQSITTVPLYDGQQESSISMIIEQTGIKTIFCSESLIQKTIEMKKNGLLNPIKNIIQFEKINDQTYTECAEIGLQIYSLQELCHICPKGVVNPPKPETWFTLCYTSGTTGIPKGAIITHKNIISMICGSRNHKIQYCQDDIHISYLPLAHIMDRFTCYQIISFGGSIGFYSGDILKLREDIIALKPTIFISVPRIFNRYYSAINNIFSSEKGFKKGLIKKALRDKIKAFEENGFLDHAIWDRLIFNKIKGFFGGRVRIFCTGSAPLSNEVMKFFRVVFSCPFIEGYGQTETSGISFRTNIEEKKVGTVGGPILTIEFKLVDVPEMDYYTTDKDENGLNMPRGEICIRGNTVIMGYYKSPHLTAEIIDEEGWLHSGDIGMILPENGALKIIDRKKNIFKLSQGEYVAPEKLENIYLRIPFILQIFVYGDSFQSYLVAILVPDEGFIRAHWASKYGYQPGVSFDKICQDEKLKQFFIEEMRTIANKEELLGFEHVRNIYLEPKPWTIEDFLTPTQKLTRHKAKNHYKTVIDTLYGGKGKNQDLCMENK